MILPLVTTTALLLVPWHVTPTAFTIHAPSKLRPPPSVRRGAGLRASGDWRRAGRSRSTARSWREPETALSSLPMLPPALPCAWATGAHVPDSQMPSKMILMRE